MFEAAQDNSISSSRPRALPQWQTLPEEVRHELTSLSARLIVDPQALIIILRNQRKHGHDV
jgi:hypothetical protein